MSQTHNKHVLIGRRQQLRKDQTKAESLLWLQLRNSTLNNLKFKRQHSVGFYILDFYCAKYKLAVEVDGDSHFTEEGKVYDVVRGKFLEGLGIKTIRFTNEEVFNSLDFVLKEISTSPNLSLQRRGI